MKREPKHLLVKYVLVLTEIHLFILRYWILVIPVLCNFFVPVMFNYNWADVLQAVNEWIQDWRASKLPKQNWLLWRTTLNESWALTGSVANLPRSGRPEKLSMEARAFIDQQMCRNDEMTSAKIRKKLAKRGILISSSTLRRSRRQKIYYYRSIWWQ